MKKIASILLGLGLAFNASADTASSQDPYQTFNRHAFNMNDRLDKAILKPIAQGYVFIMPKVGQKGVHNFFSNFRQVPFLINDILQVDGYWIMADTWRLLINTTVGIGGLFDVATMVNVPQHTQDVGLTFAKWGYNPSRYFVVPFWGPSTIRDALGLIPYYFMTVYPYIKPAALGWGLLGLDVIDQRAQLLNLDDVAKKAALDPYAFQRNAYLQRRNALINANSGTPDANTAFENEEDADIDNDDDLDDEDALK